MSASRRSSRLLAIVAMLLIVLVTVPAATAAQPGNAVACKQGGWETLAPADAPTVAFASQGDCVSYLADGGDPVALQAAPEESEPAPGDSENAPGQGAASPGNSEDAPGHDAEPGNDTPANDAAEACRQGAWAELAPVETPTIRFDSEGECVSHAAQGGAIVPVQAVQEPAEADDGPGTSDAAEACRQGDWAELAPIETPLDAFDSQADCIRYAADGGDAVDAISFNVASAHDDCAAAAAYVPGEGTSLSGLHLYGCDLAGHDLSGADLSGAILIDADLTNATLTRAFLQGADLRYADLTGANLSGADLGDANLSSATLTGADLSNTGLSKANLSGATMINANLSGTRAQYANLSGATMINANLSGADLSGTELIAANLTGANLTNANLSGANMAYAYLSGADVTGANFPNATCPDNTAAVLTGFEVRPDKTVILYGSCDGHLTWP